MLSSCVYEFPELKRIVLVINPLLFCSVLFANLKKARPVLLNGVSRKGERLVPAASLDSVMRAAFPAESARTKVFLHTPLICSVLLIYDVRILLLTTDCLVSCTKMTILLS